MRGAPGESTAMGTVLKAQRLRDSLRRSATESGDRSEPTRHRNPLSPGATVNQSTGRTIGDGKPARPLTREEKGPHLCGPFCGGAGNRNRCSTRDFGD
jgi:hypothetical protein